MGIFIVVNNPKNWSFNIPGVNVISAKNYLIDQSYSQIKGAKIFNLSRSYSYQSIGYYVSLLAIARGHKVMPDVPTIQDMKSQAVVRIIGEDLEKLVEENLKDLSGEKFSLNIYFGKSVDKKYEKLSLQLFNMFPAPLLKASFAKNSGKWAFQNISPMPSNEIVPEEKLFVEESAKKYFSGRKFSVPKRNVAPYDMAILINPDEKDAAPSDEKALAKFEKAAEKLGFNVEFITKDDYNKIAEFDALFIRETTKVNHHTFRFSQRAAAEGLVVIDDPISILRCSNKVYLAELLKMQEIPAPKTIILHQDNVNSVIDELGFPCILKQPDSSFSLGVVKVNTKKEFLEKMEQLINTSDLIVAQEFLPTEFDWRVGILDKEPLYVCKYFMARKHWQIMNWKEDGNNRYGKYEVMVPEMAPRQVIRTALKAANLIGDGLYGVDLKQIGKKCYIIEINDNPSIDAGVEDKILKDKLYKTIMESFLRRVREKKEGSH
ncbi:MAG: glutathione synthase [Spirochaetes bacterium GWB1_36_13]|nr:MAG: glutathione synthase [Spirochaetes bacterium GWB1_36_13]